MFFEVLERIVEMKGSPEKDDSIINKRKGAVGQQRKLAKGFGFRVSDSMSDISSESDFESEVGYASCEKDDSVDSDEEKPRRLNKPRKRLQRKHRLEQLKKYDIYSNDSDTTVDESANNSRKLKVLKVTKKVASGGKIEETNSKLFIEKVLSNREDITKDIRRPRNGSKGSWTDSGVSMSKTDSQPSTLGDRTHAARVMSKKIGYIDESGMLAGGHVNYDDSSVDLVRGEIGRRSRSVSEYLKQARDERQKNCKSAPLQFEEETEKEHGDPIGFENGRIDGSKDTSDCKIAADKEEKIRRKGSLRHPEIIKTEIPNVIGDSKRIDIQSEKSLDQNKSNNLSKSEKENSNNHINSCSNNNNKIECEHFNEKECEIIRQLVENAKEAERKFSSTSQGTSQHQNEDEETGYKKSRFQRIKNLLTKNRKQNQQNCASTKHPSMSQYVERNERSFSPKFERSSFSDNASIQGQCEDRSCCCCEYDDEYNKGLDNLSHLGRTVSTKKWNFFTRLFKSSSKHNFDQNIDNYRSRSQTESEFGRKRSGSTRSLPDSLKHLWIKAISKSAENVTSGGRFATHIHQENGPVYSPADLIVRRSRSSSSLIKSQCAPYLRIDLSRSCETLSHKNQAIYSPPTPMRRSGSLRSLNIGKNYDIATHVLQGKSPAIETTENNNLFYHPYFEGHAAKDDCIQEGNHQLPLSHCCCCMTSPLVSPRRSLPNENGPSLFQCNPAQSPCHTPVQFAMSPRRKSSISSSLFQENIFSEHCTPINDNCRQCQRAQMGDSQSVIGLINDDVISPRQKYPTNDDCLIVAPLKVTVMKEKHAEKVRLKTKKNFDTFV